MSAAPSRPSSRRRDALRRAARVLGGAAVAWLVPVPSNAQAGKLDRAAVSYVDHGTEPGKDCDDCLQFVPGPDPQAPGTCRIVEGPVSPHGHCIAFTPKPRASTRRTGASGPAR